jgi:hypothetical protein
MVEGQGAWAMLAAPCGDAGSDYGDGCVGWEPGRERERGSVWGV